MRVLVAGLSVRAAAESAARAGFEVTAVDAFSDLDQHAAVRCLAPVQPFSARAAARAARGVRCDAAVYLANFENDPEAVEELAAGRTLWGNSAAVLRRVRDPRLLKQALEQRGIATPALRFGPEAGKRGRESFPIVSQAKKTPDPFPPPRRWLVKPLRSGGGHDVRPWRPGTAVPPGCHLQEVVDGTPVSAAFVAAGGRATLLGLCRILVGDGAFGAEGFRYCGNILAPVGDRSGSDDEALRSAAGDVAAALAEAFGLVGVNGVDFVAHGGVAHPIEVNPRWSGSMELIERAYGLSIFAAHAAACAKGSLPSLDLARAGRCAGAVGKAVVFARRDLTVGDTSRWLGDESVRDVPRPGERIAAGRPICTVFAAGPDAAACRDGLVHRAERVYAALAPPGDTAGEVL